MAAKFAFIDNDPESALNELADALGKKKLAVLRYPEDFRPDQAETSKKVLDQCHVVLMDLELYESTKKPSLSLAPLDGLALEQIIRGWLDGAGHALDIGTTAFVLFSHHLESLGSVVANREHVLARKTGNEWVSSKNCEKRPEIHKDLKFLNELAVAISSLPDKWPEETEKAKAVAIALLGIDDASADDWRSLAVADAEKCGLPLQSILEGRGISLIRWLLHVALPFPGALSDAKDVAVSLRLEPNALVEGSKARAALDEVLSPYRYSGQLKGFLGPRWWRSGVNAFVLDLASKTGGKREQIWRELASRLRMDITELLTTTLSDPVLVVDDQFRRTSSLHDSSECVRMLTDDWPASIEFPWMTIEMASSSARLKSLVHPDDAYRMD